MKLIKPWDQARIVNKEEYGRVRSRASVICDNTNKIISSYNKYFNYSMNQTYYVEKNETYHQFSLEFKTPKWLYDKVNALIKNHVSLTTLLRAECIFMKVDPNYIFFIHSFWPSAHTAHLVYKSEGLCFLSPREMISFREEFASQYKRSLLGIKNLTVEELLQHTVDYDLIKENIVKHTSGMVQHDMYFDLCAIE